MTETIFDKHVFDVYFDFFVWPKSQLLTSKSHGLWLQSTTRGHLRHFAFSFLKHSGVLSLLSGYSNNNPCEFYTTVRFLVNHCNSSHIWPLVKLLEQNAEPHMYVTKLSSLFLVAKMQSLNNVHLLY